MAFCGFPVFFKRSSRISPEFRQNFELEHLNTGDSHNSSFPHLSVRLFRKASGGFPFELIFYDNCTISTQSTTMRIDRLVSREKEIPL